jgi:sugar lactone lactonase YvrE
MRHLLGTLSGSLLAHVGRVKLFLAVLLLSLYTASSTAVFAHRSAPPLVETIALFNPQTPDTPESIVIDPDGNQFISMALTGEIRKIAADGSQSTYALLPIGSFTPLPLSGIMGALALDDEGTIYVSVVAADPANRGVWAVAPDGTIRLIANLPANAAPNGIARERNNLYIADSELGVVWRVPVSGGNAQIWADDPRLKQTPGDLFPGPNGLQIFRAEVYVSNSETGTILAIQLNDNDTAGAIRIHASGVQCDDFAFDVQGNLYCTTDPFNTLVRVAPDGTRQVLLTAADGLDGPTAAAFGRTGDTNFDLYITNAAFPFFSTSHRPSLMRLHLDIPGAPHHP